MSSWQADSLEVVFANHTSSSTLRFFHRTGLLSSQRKELKTLTPPSGNNMTVSSFVFQFEKGTNEFIDVEYKVEMENQVEVENENDSVRRRPGVNRGTYKPIGVRIDSTMLRDHSKISVVDSEAAQSGAAASSRKKFKLQKESRADQYKAGWLFTLVLTLYAFFRLKYAFSGLKYVFSGFRNLLPDPISEPPAAAPEPPVEGTDAGLRVSVI